VLGNLAVRQIRTRASGCDPANLAACSAETARAGVLALPGGRWLLGPNYIALAVPFFFALIALELAVAARRGRRGIYRFADALADLGCGVAERVVLLFVEALLLLVYIRLYEHARLADLAPYPLAAWLVAIVGVDIGYYWWHRLSHRINFLWTAHVVHHQSEDYNLAVALRQGVLTPFTLLPFGLPLALVGVPPLVFAVASAVNLLYQFWIHTELIVRLGPLEHVLNTPSNHRVHHARNPGYIDRNYAGMFIVWDRLFGSYVPEREPAVFGITKPLRSFNALWAQVKPVTDLVALSGKAPTLREAVAVWLAPPERVFPWERRQRPDGGGGGGDDAAVPPPLKYDVVTPARVRLYVLVNFALAVAATFVMMLFGSDLSRPALALGAGLVLFTIFTTAGLTEGRRWARPLEAARVVAVVLAAAGYLGSRAFS
jgi:alkylglycerol monooxygenase